MVLTTVVVMGGPAADEEAAGEEGTALTVTGPGDAPRAMAPFTNARLPAIPLDLIPPVLATDGGVNVPGATFPGEPERSWVPGGESNWFV